MAVDAFVPLTADGGRRNDGARMKPPGRPARPARPMLRAVVRMAAEAAAAQPVRGLWKNQLAPGNIATTMTGDDNNENRPKIGSSVFGQIIGVSILSKRAETALAGVKGELPNFARAGEGSSKFKGLFDDNG